MSAKKLNLRAGPGENYSVLGVIERGLLAGRVFWFYLGKLAWPADLIFIYPRWRPDPAAVWQWLFPGAALALFAGAVFSARRHPQGRAVLAAPDRSAQARSTSNSLPIMAIASSARVRSDSSVL